MGGGMGGGDMMAGAGEMGGGGGGMLSGVQGALTGMFSGGAMSNKTIEEQRKFAGESITKAFDAFGGMQPSASGKATSTPVAWTNSTPGYADLSGLGSGAGLMQKPYQPIDPTGTLYWWLPQGQMG
jgi:hypothetical protein